MLNMPIVCLFFVQMGVLIHELLALELWREKVFPLMLESSTHPTSGFPADLVVRRTPPPP